MDIQNVIWYIKVVGDFDYNEAELEKLGLREMCRLYNIDFEDLSETEKRVLWEELSELAREIEFNRDFSENYERD